MDTEIPQLENGEAVVITEQQVVEALQMHGVDNQDDPEGRKILYKWSEQEKKKSGLSTESSVELYRRTARVYMQAGLLHEAYDTFNMARDQGREVGQSLWDEITEEMDTKLEPLMREEDGTWHPV